MVFACACSFSRAPPLTPMHLTLTFITITIFYQRISIEISMKYTNISCENIADICFEILYM